MDIEGRLRQLERHYRSTLSGAVAAKADYLSLLGEPNIQPTTIERAKARWQRLDTLKRAIAQEMLDLEELEHESTT